MHTQSCYKSSVEMLSLCDFIFPIEKSYDERIVLWLQCLMFFNVCVLQKKAIDVLVFCCHFCNGFIGPYKIHVFWSLLYMNSCVCKMNIFEKHYVVSSTFCDANVMKKRQQVATLRRTTHSSWGFSSFYHILLCV